MMRWGLFLVAVLALYGCRGGRNGLLPGSGGRPYEVLLVGDRDSIVYKALTTDVDGLPQPEPSFDVSQTDSAHFNRSVWTARSIVMVRVNPSQYTVTRIRYEKNVYSEPQMVVYVNTPSVADLKRRMPQLAPMLRDLLNRAEINNEISRLQTERNQPAEQQLSKKFGWNVRVPADMLSSKEGKNFVWFSNNYATGMQNICVYTLPMKRLTKTSIISGRDSVMRANIPGERNGTYMQTAAETVSAGMTDIHGTQTTVVRGLWEMRGDAMGGPFVAHVVADTPNNRYIVAEAFVYAPEMKKRNKLRLTEAVLYTLAEDKRK